jgi:beta-glucosidase
MRRGRMKRDRGRGLLALIIAAVAFLPATGALALPPPAQPWLDASRTPDERAHLLVAALTLDEKISLMHGIGTETGTGYVGAHTGALPPIPRVRFPGMHFADGPLGVHGPGLLTTELPSGVALAATFDPAVARDYGTVIGREARAKNNDVVFGPMVNMVRTYEAGRNFETYGEDPFLASRIAVADIRGIQGQGVIATTKHYVAYNQELESNTTVPGTAVDAVVDERTLHEIYMPAFEAAVQEAGTGSVMSAYNKVNGAYNAENCPLLKDTLKGAFGFAGFVVSDYDSTHGSALDVNCGNDVEQPDGTNYANLQADVTAGRVGLAAIDDAVFRVLREAFAFGVFERPACPGVDSCFAIDQGAGSAVALRVAEESTVLLKNEAVSGQPLLPIDTTRVHTVALVGPGADKVAKGHGSSEVNPLHEVTPLQGITARAGSPVNVLFSSNPVVQLANAATADIAIVFVGDSAGEGADRQCLYLSCPGWTDFQPNADALVSATLAANPHTVVVLNSGAPDVLAWADLAPAMIQGWYPGGEQGSAIAAVLFGDYNPGGRLPVSFPRLQTDQPAPTPQQYPGVANEAQYSEGMYIGYRHFDRNNIQPLFAFGHGLSYTTFRYSNLTVSGPMDTGIALTRSGLGGPSAQVGFDVTNTGSRRGDDVPQLYIAPPPNAPVDEPVRQLQGFARVTLEPGRTAHLTLPVPIRAVSFYDVQAHGWRALPGCHQVQLGSSERDIRLSVYGVNQALQPCAAAPAAVAVAAPRASPAALPGTTTTPRVPVVVLFVTVLSGAAVVLLAAAGLRRSSPRG